MEARTELISGVIQKNTLLRIPFFQRRYVWEESDWERFAVDMASTLDSTRNYFLGAIILKEEKEPDREERLKGIARKYLVVDGQQRLTTLCIFMKVLHMLTSKTTDFNNQYLLASEDAQTPVVVHSCEDRAHFREIMLLETLKEVDESSNIFKAYMYFRNYLKQLRENEGVNLSDMLNTIIASITFVVITLKQGDDEQQIFDTINSLGVPLTTGELLKNFLYEKEDEQAYNENWKPVFDLEGDQEFWGVDYSKQKQAKTKDNSAIERFFYAFVRIKMWDFKDKLDEGQKKTFVKKENVFSTCKAFHEDFGMTKQALANEIISYAKLFKEYFNENNLKERIPKYASIQRIACFINATKNYAVIPYVLYVLHEVSDIEERNRIFGYLETYLIRRVLAGSSMNSYSDLFSQDLIGQRKNTYIGVKNYIEGKGEDANLAMPSLARVESGINNRQKTIDDTTARIIYYLYETKVGSVNDGVDGGFNDYYVERLMPKKAGINWPAQSDNNKEDFRQQQLGTLGNCFLLENGGSKDMRKMQDAPCSKKAEIMLHWTGKIRSNGSLKVAQVDNPITSWTEDNISNRNIGLARIFCNNVWTL